MGVIYINEKQTQKNRISRRADGSGIIRINEETCDLIEGVMDKLEDSYSIGTVVGALLKAAVDQNIIKEGK